MNKLNGEFKVGDRVTIHQWHYNEDLDLKDRLNFPINGTIKSIGEYSPQYGIKIDNLPEKEHKGSDNLWWFYKKEFSLIEENPFTTKSFFTGKNTTPPKTKEIPQYEIIDLYQGRIALLTKEKIYFFYSASVKAVKESFENNYDNSSLADYVIDTEDLKSLYNSMQDINSMYVDEHKVEILHFAIGCQDFTFDSLDLVVETINQID